MEIIVKKLFDARNVCAFANAFRKIPLLQFLIQIRIPVFLHSFGFLFKNRFEKLTNIKDHIIISNLVKIYTWF